MKVILATGIYPPEIGGPATYVRALAGELSKKGVDVTVITYGEPHTAEDWKVIKVSKSIPILRWISYALALRAHGKDADAVIAFSSISAGVPLWLSHLTKPKKILRLGGDFFWERYTDQGGMKSLREWYASKPQFQGAMQTILSTFDHIIFSTRFQEEIYEKFYSSLPAHRVIENALPAGLLRKHERHSPFRILFMGRFVGFKNLETLVRAVGARHALPLQGRLTLTFVGDGPMKSQLQSLIKDLHIEAIVQFFDPVHGEEKQTMFAGQDLLVIPSITEISPNVALEARSAGLPVLLTQETGLSEWLTKGMLVKDLSTEDKIRESIIYAMDRYDEIAASSAPPPIARGWDTVAEEWIQFLRSSR